MLCKGSGKEVTIQQFVYSECGTVAAVTGGATGTGTNSLRNICRLQRENIRQIHYSRQLYWEHHT
jgi:hypothetical protein